MLLSCIAGFSVSAQNAETDNLFTTQETAKAEPYEVYCELIAYTNGIFTNKVTIDIDFGQAAAFWSRDRALTDENGNRLVFNSLLDAANYLGKRGWVFKQAYIIQSMTDGDSGTPYHHWIMAKRVTSESEITEGLTTQGMVRK